MVLFCSKTWCNTIPTAELKREVHNGTTIEVEYFPSNDTECPGGECPLSSAPHTGCAWMTDKVLRDMEFLVTCDRAIEDAFEARAAKMKQDMEQDAYHREVAHWAEVERDKPETEKPFSAPEKRPLTGSAYYVVLPKNSTPASGYWNEFTHAARAVEMAVELSHPDCVRCQGKDGVGYSLPKYITDDISKLYCPHCQWEAEIGGAAFA